MLNTLRLSLFGLQRAYRQQAAGGRRQAAGEQYSDSLR